MITAGIDLGAKTTKVVILRDGKVLGRGLALTGFEQKEAAGLALSQALGQAGLTQ